MSTRNVVLPRHPVGRGFRAIEDAVAVAALFLLSAFPLLEILLRTVFRTGILGQSAYLVHFVLILAFVGGMITAREGRHLSISGGYGTQWIRMRNALDDLTSFISVTVATALGWSAVSLLVLGFTAAQTVGVVPARLFVGVMPVGFFVIALRFTRRGLTRTTRILVGGAGLLAGTYVGIAAAANMIYMLAVDIPAWVDRIVDGWYTVMPRIAVPGAVVVAGSALFGTPLFIVLGGTALFLFAEVGGSIEVIPNEAYNVLTDGTIPAIPLFTFTGYILSESKAGERLVTLFRAWFGWLPGGMVVAAVLVSAFFTSFTGASGVTILALGGLLYYVLHTRGRQSEPFTVGLLTSASNIGILFPPSLAIILYGTIAQVNIFHMFLAGIVPGVLMALAFIAIGVIVSVRRGVKPTAFDPREAGSSLLSALSEILLPVVIVTAFFTGLTTLVETAALAVAYVLIVEAVIRREIPVRRLPEVALKCIVITGGVLMILGAARGLSFYIVDAQVPIVLRDWMRDHVTSRFVFLLILNGALLATGCLMDIFSAIMIVAPLVVPLGELFGVAPVHLGAIFLANLGLGFITPPVGIDLFLSSYRFDQRMPRLYRYVLPFFLVELAVVLLITYVPFFARFLPGIVS
ncbi:MAG: TRAP transporter large permease subunit [Spirochaetaceae bacterium]